TRRDHGNVHRARHGACEFNIIAAACAIAIDAREQDLPRPVRHALSGPLHRIERRTRRSAVRADAPAPALTTGVDTCHHTLSAKSIRTLREQCRTLHRGGVETYLVRARAQRPRDIRRRAHATANHEWDEQP